MTTIPIETTATPAAVTGTEVFIPLDKLKKHPNNARKTPHSEASIEAKAASIHAKGILQNLVVEPEVDAEGAATGFYLVIIGEGRRLAQLLRVKRKQIKKTEPTVVGAMENRHDCRDVDERGADRGLCVLAYTLAVYALPFMLAVEAARFAYATGSGLIGAGFVGLLAGAAAYGLLVFAFTSLRSPVLRLIVALVFAAPAAVAGDALVHGITREAVPSEVWRQISASSAVGWPACRRC